MTTRHFLWRLMRATPWLSLGVFMVYSLYSVLPLVFGLIMREFFNALAGESQAGFNVWTLVVLFLITRVVVQFFEIGGAGLSALHYYVVEAMLRRNVFRTLIQTTGYTPPQSSGEILNRYNEDTEAIAETIFRATYGITLPIGTLVTIGIMASINLPLTLIALLPLMLTMILMNRFGGRIQRYHEAAREASGQVSGLLTQLLNGVQAVKVATAEQAALARFERLSDQRRQAIVRDTTFSTWTRSMSETAISVATGLILIFAASLMQNGTFTVGDFALFVSYIALSDGNIGGLVNWVGELIELVKQAEVSFERLFVLVPTSADHRKIVATDSLYLRGEIPAPPQPDKTSHDSLRQLEVSGLTYHHPGTTQGIDNITFTLERGMFVVITGRIGAGKTLLLETLLGLRPRQGGTIRWNGQPIDDPATFFVPPRCAYTPQVPRLFSDTLRDNILLGLSEPMVDLTAALSAAVLDPDIQQLENGLDTFVGPRGVRLSGGQMQRAAAARMFVRQPDLYLFDDLSSALDVETERLLWERLFAQQRATYLVVSHRRVALQRADKIIILREGRVEASGTLEALLETCASMRALWTGSVDEA